MACASAELETKSEKFIFLRKINFCSLVLDEIDLQEKNVPLLSISIVLQDPRTQLPLLREDRQLPFKGRSTASPLKEHFPFKGRSESRLPLAPQKKKEKSFARSVRHLAVVPKTAAHNEIRITVPQQPERIRDSIFVSSSRDRATLSLEWYAACRAKRTSGSTGDPKGFRVGNQETNL